MSETPVGEMEAGRELDCRVAELVFGSVLGIAPIGDGLSRTAEFEGPTLASVDERIRAAYAKWVERGDRLWPAYYCGPEYSTEISAAWEVVEAMRLTVGPTDGRWFAAGFDAHETADMEGHPYIDASPHILAVADTAPLAICIAAIAAIKAGTTPTREASVPTPAPRAPGE